MPELTDPEMSHDPTRDLLSYAGLNHPELYRNLCDRPRSEGYAVLNEYVGMDISPMDAIAESCMEALGKLRERDAWNGG